MEVDKTLKAGSTILLVLSLLENGDLYGYKIIEELENRSDNTFSLKAGTLYPILHDLEQKGAIESYEAPGEGKRIRKYYHITNQGKKLLKEKKKEWKIYAAAVKQVLGGKDFA